MQEKDIIICGHGSNTPSLKRMNEYLTTRYNSIATNGKHKGLIAVKRLKALNDAGRDKFQETYKTIIGRNCYNQDLRQYVFTKYNGKYYSDCSSSGMATFQKIGYDVGLFHTALIYNSNLFETVDVKIKNGHVLNPEVLKIGDCLLFVGNDPTRPLQIGHVEYVYDIKDQHFTYSYNYPKKDFIKDVFNATKGKNPIISKMTNNKHAVVKYIQRYISQLGYDCGNIDGIYGNNTKNAVVRWQNDNNLTPDGIIGANSWKRILS